MKPKIQIKFSPTNGKDISSSGERLGYDSLFSINRIGRSDMVEEGKSLSVGLEYEKLNLSNEKLIGFNIGNIFKDKKNSSMPAKSKLDQTRSDIIGSFFYEPNEKFNSDRYILVLSKSLTIEDINFREVNKSPALSFFNIKILDI